jgi:hypothetical protein
VILRVTKRGLGRSASPTVRLKGEKALGERGPWEPLGGRLGAVAPPASFNVQEVPRDKGCAATPLRVRVMGGGGWFFAGGWLVRGVVGEGVF